MVAEALKHVSSLGDTAEGLGMPTNQEVSKRLGSEARAGSRLGAGRGFTGALPLEACRYAHPWQA